MELEGVKEGLDNLSLSLQDWASLPVDTHGSSVFALA